jgi:hypothetical protein
MQREHKSRSHCSTNTPLSVDRIEIGSFGPQSIELPGRLQRAERMHHWVFGRTPLNTIPGNTAQEPLTEQYDDGYDEQGDYCLDQAQAVPQLFHVVASHVPPSLTYRLKISHRRCGPS